MTNRKVVFISGHLWRSRRRAGFHHLADAFHRLGWTVIFATVALSRFSMLRRDYRLDEAPSHERNRLLWVNDTLGYFTWYTPWHPVDFRLGLVNQALSALVKAYANLPLGDLAHHVRDADLFVFESTPGIVLFERFKQLNMHATYVYRVSDSLRALDVHPELLSVEQRIAPAFDLVSVPSPLIAEFFPPLCRLHVHRHGLDKGLFDLPCSSPYGAAGGRPQAVSVGTMLFDRSFFALAAEGCPQIDFHIIGAAKKVVKRQNVFLYGEMPFASTVPYLRYADLGLAPYRQNERAAYLADSSLKMIQYTYCRLPIVAPIFAAAGRKHAMPYIPGDCRSIKHALLAALSFDRNTIKQDVVKSWGEVAKDILSSI